MVRIEYRSAGRGSKSRGVPPGVFYRNNAKRELSIFVDKAEQQDMSDGYYLLTLVVHDQSASIGDHVEEYERRQQTLKAMLDRQAYAQGELRLDAVRGCQQRAGAVRRLAIHLHA